MSLVTILVAIFLLVYLGLVVVALRCPSRSYGRGSRTSRVRTNY